MFRSRTASGDQGAKFSLGGLIAWIIVLVAATVGYGVWRHHQPAINVPSSQTYCNNVGKVCFSYPSSWRLTTLHQQVTVTDPTTKTSIQYSPQTYVATSACSGCSFQTLSAYISDGFANGNDVAGVYWQKGLANYAPEYVLVSTAQLLGEGLRVGSDTNLSQGFALTFTNEAVPNLDQQLQIVAPSGMSFASSTAAQTWLHSAVAQTAESIVNSARLQSSKS